MTNEDLLYFADYAADHIASYGAWPQEFENTETGQVWEIADCVIELNKAFPSLYAALVTCWWNKND